MNLFDWLCDEATAISAEAMLVPPSGEQLRWSEDERRTRWLQQLGLWPLPERTPLEATITGTLERPGYVVEKLHYQALPGAHIAGNLYLPAEIDEPLPAVLYLCGHTKGKVSPLPGPAAGSARTAIALVVDPMQSASARASSRNSTGRWTDAAATLLGAEVWAGMRSTTASPDVDARRMGVTGLSVA